MGRALAERSQVPRAGGTAEVGREDTIAKGRAVQYCAHCGETVVGDAAIHHCSEILCPRCHRQAGAGTDAGPANGTTPPVKAAAAPGPGPTARRNRAPRAARPQPVATGEAGSRHVLFFGAAALGVAVLSVVVTALALGGGSGTPAPEPDPHPGTGDSAVEPTPDPVDPPPAIVDPPDDRDPPPPTGEFVVGNRRTSILHREACEYGRSIGESNREDFPSAAAALDRGDRWCRSCGPGE